MCGQYKDTYVGLFLVQCAFACCLSYQQWASSTLFEPIEELIGEFFY